MKIYHLIYRICVAVALVYLVFLGRFRSDVLAYDCLGNQATNDTVGGHNVYVANGQQFHVKETLHKFCVHSLID